MKVYYPAITEVIDTAKKILPSDWDQIPLLAHTHGQPASPTRLGKEIQVFVERIEKQLAQLQQVPTSAAKFGGATGNFNAHNVAYPASTGKLSVTILLTTF
jgi:adenylosuccinate lyase